jgi:hypothetical protein
LNTKIYYFSGTGNSLYIAKRIAEFWDKQNKNGIVQGIEKFGECEMYCWTQWLPKNGNYITEFGRTKNISGIDAISGATWSYNILYTAPVNIGRCCRLYNNVC